MASKKNFSGVQYNPKGATQGITLVDPDSGDPYGTVVDTGGTKRLAVDAQVSVDVAALEVNLDVDNDGVHIGDQSTGDLLTVNPDGSLDANVEVDASDGDNIAISDGSNNVDLNVVGSKFALAATEPAQLIRTDKTTTANTTYVGYADPNTATSSASWQVLRVIDSSGNKTLEYADGNDSYDNVWDNRASLIYS